MSATVPGAPGEIIVIPDDAEGVSCDGGGGALGHPLVWYALAGTGSAECGYCDRLFVRASAKARFVA